MARKLSLMAVLAAMVISMVPAIAQASVTGDCTGEAEIKGVSYGPGNDTPSNAIPIPDEDGVIVTYSGSVDFENKGHSGVAKVQVGPFGITLDKPWSGSNEQDDRGVVDNTYALDDFRDQLPIWIPGVWKVTASHSASGGECSGFAMVKLEGNALGNPVGLVTLVLLLAAIYALVRAIMRRRMVAAIIFALLFGLLLSLMLMMMSVRPLETLTVVVVPIVLAGASAAIVIVLNRRQPTFPLR